jgi:hypothetical protein
MCYFQNMILNKLAIRSARFSTQPRLSLYEMVLLVRSEIGLYLRNIGSRQQVIVCGSTGSYQCRICLYKSHSIHKSLLPVGTPLLPLTWLCPPVVAKVPLKSPIYVPSICGLFFSTFSLLLLSCASDSEYQEPIY